MLDAVPDSVFILEKETEEIAGKPLYANIKMNAFFGCDIVRRPEKTTEKTTKKKHSYPTVPRPDTAEPLKRKLFHPQGLSTNEEDALSLLDIIKNEATAQAHQQDGDGGEQAQRKSSKMFQVTKAANPYASQEESSRTINIKLLDVLYNDRICSLVYMQDLTSVQKNQEQGELIEHMMLSNEIVTSQLRGPQQSIVSLTQQLIDTCPEVFKETLQGI